MAEPAGSTNAMQVSLCSDGVIKINDNVDGQDVNTSGKDVRAHQTSGLSIFEVVEDPKQSEGELLTYYGLPGPFWSGCSNMSNPGH